MEVQHRYRHGPRVRAGARSLQAVLAVALCAGMGVRSRADLLAAWDFEDADLVADAGTPVNRAQTIGSSSAAQPTFPQGNGSATAASFTQVHLANQSYVEIPVDTTGYGALAFIYAARTSNTASKYWRFEVSTAGRAGPFVGVGPIIEHRGGVWVSEVIFHLDALPAAANNPALVLHLVPTDSRGDGTGEFIQADGEGVPSAQGTFRIDDVIVQGIPLKAITPTPTPQPTPRLPTLIINEVDSDTPGADRQEFIELYDGGFGHIALDGFTLVLYDGRTDAVYAAWDLQGFRTDARGYFILGNAAVSGAGLIFPDGRLQNGPDAVALYLGRATEFPVGAPLTTENLRDAVVYDTSDPDDPELLALLLPGEPQLNEDALGRGTINSLQRCPNGSGGARQTRGFIAAPASPGLPNFCSGETPLPSPSPQPAAVRRRWTLYE